MPANLILASTSSTRKLLLQRLQLPFTTRDPQVDETPHIHEKPDKLACRLAAAKAAVISQQQPTAWVIGSDQVAYLPSHQQQLHKPETVDNAILQLTQCSGQQVVFYTAVSLQNASLQFNESLLVPFSIDFRPLPPDEITRYVHREMPLHCAGSFQCEGLGISLFERMQGEDQTALMGLPLLALCQLLRQAGFTLP